VRHESPSQPWPAGHFALLRRFQRSRVGFHFGVGLPNGRVIELQPGGAFALSLGQFAGGQKLTVLRTVEVGESAAMERRLRLACSQRRRYDLLGWNCESFARYVIEGVPKSREVGAAFMVVAIIGALFAF
jgi:hypothetical protein